MKRIGLLKVCFFVRVHSMEFVSHVKFRQLQTTLGILEHYLFFCHQTGMVGHWILRLHTFYKLPMLNLKICQQFKYWHQSINKYCTDRAIYLSESHDHRWAKNNWRRWSVAEHKQYKAGALKRKRQVKQSGNILK